CVAGWGWFAAVGEEFFAPAAQPVGAGGEGGERGPVDGGLEGAETPLGFGPVVRAVDGAETFLQSPRFGEQRFGQEELAEDASFALAEPLGAFEQPSPRAPQLGAEAAAALFARDRP